MVLDSYVTPPSDEELKGAKNDAKEHLCLWTRRAFYAVIGLLFICLMVVPFAKGHALHGYAEPFGRILVYLAMALFVWVVICVGVVVNSWWLVRSLGKGKP